MDAIFLTLAAPEKIGNRAAHEHRGPEEPAPCGNADQTDHQYSGDNEQTDGMTRPEATAKSAIRDNFLSMTILVGSRDYLAQRMVTKRGIGFHGLSPFAAQCGQWQRHAAANSTLADHNVRACAVGSTVR